MNFRRGKSVLLRTSGLTPKREATASHQMQLDYMSVITTSVAKQISEQIREAIVNGQLQVGQRLPTEDDLAQKYGVSRPTIREALKRLAAQNLIRSRRGPAGG